MAMILDTFLKRYLNKLADLIHEEVAITLHVKDDLIKLQETLESITDVLEDAEGKRIEDKGINNWVAKLKDVMYDADDIIDLCRIKGEGYGSLLEDQPSTSSTPKVRGDFSPLFSCFNSMLFRRQIGRKIKSINERIEQISKDNLTFKLQQTPWHEPSGVTRQTAPVPEVDMVGRKIEEETRKIIESLVKSNQQRFCVFAITGMGGIGKTTLAQNIYNDQMIKNTYSDQKIRSNFQALSWVCVTQNFSETELLKEIIRNVGGHYGEAVSKAELLPVLRNAVSGKNVFLVLDDVWKGEVWNDLLRNPLVSSAAGGRILITTRHEQVAKDMGVVHIHKMKKMDDEDGWLLLQKKAFGNAENEEAEDLKDIGMEIVKRCDGLPLAIKTIAGVLRTKERNRREWEMILQSHAWSMGELPQEIRGALYLSYEDLPSHLKQCFLYFSLYPAGWVFHQHVMALYWVAEGFVETRGDSLMEDLAKDYFNELIKRSLLQQDLRYSDMSKCTMHDLLHSLAQFLAQNESFLGDVQELNSRALSKLRRLSIANNKEISKFPDAIRDLKCLRTLMILDTSVKSLDKDLSKFLKHLRVLDLSWTKIERLPDSICNLIHLRLLNLAGSDVRELPESVGLLRNLQILILNRCRSLCTLPTSYSQLCSLRCLHLRGSQLSHLPKGIKNLKNLNLLTGFVVGDGASEEVQKETCSFDELESLSQLRYLYIDKLDRVHIGSSALILKNMPHLYDLSLHCSPRTHNDSQPQCSEEEISKTEQVYEKLYPPPSLGVLAIRNYFGCAFPSWMSLSLNTSFPYLRWVFLEDFTCQKLPPLGQLPELSFLGISGASGVVKIGQEFLGTEVVKGQHRAARRAAFPKLVRLKIENMPNWEEWSWGVEDDGRRAASLHHLPCLEYLQIIDCPKLRALPAGLKQLRLHIEGAHSLSVIENLPSMSGGMHLKNNSMLKRISNIPTLQRLWIDDCTALKHVENLGALQILHLWDDSMESLPQWLLALLQQQQSSVNGGLQYLYLECSSQVFNECLDGGLYWQIIQGIPRVRVFDECGCYLNYTKTPFNYETFV